MTQPTVIFFGPDGGSHEGKKARTKVYLRTLLYSTSRRGQVLESMHVNVQRGESRQNFSFWVYGDQHLSRGSGLYVGPEGVACNHHFVMPADGTEFALLTGQYTVRVFGKLVSDRAPGRLAEIILTITESQALELQREDAGIHFDWGPDQQAYYSHVEMRKRNSVPPWLVDEVLP